MIRFEHVTKRYPDGTTAVEDLDFEVAEGELVTLVGPSGCGKTTTMKMVNRLIEPTSGRILLGGEDIAAADPVELRRRIGYVIQQVGLFPHKTVLENTATVPQLIGTPKAKARARAAELLELVGLDPAVYGGRYPEQLSGGQRQRVGVARALAADPPVLLMDEPFGAVDPVVRERLQNEFLTLQKTVRKTILLVTHDLEEAIRLGDRIAVYGNGTIEQFARPAAVLAAPATEYVAGFVGADRGLKHLAVTAVAPADVEAADGKAPTAEVALGASLREALALLLREDSGRIGVKDPDTGALVGVLTPEGCTGRCAGPSCRRRRHGAAGVPAVRPGCGRSSTPASGRSRGARC